MSFLLELAAKRVRAWSGLPVSCMVAQRLSGFAMSLYEEEYGTFAVEKLHGKVPPEYLVFAEKKAEEMFPNIDTARAQLLAWWEQIFSHSLYGVPLGYRRRVVTPVGVVVGVIEFDSLPKEEGGHVTIVSDKWETLPDGCVFLVSGTSFGTGETFSLPQTTEVDEALKCLVKLHDSGVLYQSGTRSVHEPLWKKLELDPYFKPYDAGPDLTLRNVWAILRMQRPDLCPSDDAVVLANTSS